jgi:hypothetical protein
MTLMRTVWEQLEIDYLKILTLPHNEIELQVKGTSPRAAARAAVDEIKSALSGNITRKGFVGPRLFLRAVGPWNRSSPGEWWFDADLFNRLDAAYARTYFRAAEKKAAVRDMLRELLAITTEWNQMQEVWALALPPGERLIGYVGHGAQKLFGNIPLSAAGNRLLVGQAEQVLFPPVYDPLWIAKYDNLRP